ncbi:MAG: hypothetical protein JW959_14915 [Pirellulales bacterium]|nr:hypothetical protein [Pirellulales bacterium]
MPNPDAEQSMPMPIEGEIDQGAVNHPQNGINTADEGYVFSSADGMPEDGLMVDNGLWLGADVGPCCAVCGGGSGCPPDWYTEQGVRLMTRSRPRDLIIGSSYEGGVLTTVLSSRTAAPDLAAMYYTTLGHYFARDKKNRNHFVEFTYWGLNGWKDKAERIGQGNLYSEYAIQGFALDGFDAADLQSTYYASYTNNYEVNGRIVPRGRPDRLVMQPNGKWRRECQPGTYLSYLYGIRVFQENETFRFHSQGTSNAITYTGDYDIATHNVLLGFQFGADLTFRKCRFEWGIRAKLGPYLNFTDQQSEINSGVSLAPDFSRRLSAAKHEASLLGETGFFASYKFFPNMIGRAGYDFMWVTGMSLAPEQLQFTTNTVNQVNTNGMIYYHGVSLSMEWRW